MSGVLGVLAAADTGVFRADVNRTTLVGSGAIPGTYQTLQSVTCTGVNGQAPYTYLWDYVSGDTSIYPNTATSSTTRFSRYMSSPGTYMAVYKCIVDDSAAASVDSANVTITITGEI